MYLHADGAPRVSAGTHQHCRHLSAMHGWRQNIEAAQLAKCQQHMSEQGLLNKCRATGA